MRIFTPGDPTCKGRHYWVNLHEDRLCRFSHLSVSAVLVDRIQTRPRFVIPASLPQMSGFREECAGVTT